MAERFLFQDAVESNMATLSGEQAHHLSRVMRAKIGDRIVLFDGRGIEHDATIVEISKNSTELQIVDTRSCIDPNFPEITVAVALPKGDRQRFLIEKLVELGANRLIPLKTQRSVAEASEKAVIRIRKQVVEATKQCRRSWLMDVTEESTIPELIANYENFQGNKILADPYHNDEPSDQTGGILVAVGPEGGFTEAEIETFSTNEFKKACFSPNVLRIETAAAAAVAIIRSSNFSCFSP